MKQAIIIAKMPSLDEFKIIYLKRSASSTGMTLRDKPQNCDNN